MTSLVWVYTSLEFAQTQQNFVGSHDRDIKKLCVGLLIVQFFLSICSPPQYVCIISTVLDYLVCKCLSSMKTKLAPFLIYFDQKLYHTTASTTQITCDC